MSAISTWAAAIAQFEGYNVSGSVADRNNNPGNLKFANQPGAVGEDSSGFAIFPDPATGMDALEDQLEAYTTEYPNYSISQIMAHYLGQSSPGVSDQGNSVTYASYVAGQLGVDPSTTLSELAPLPAAAGAPPMTLDSDTGLPILATSSDLLADVMPGVPSSSGAWLVGGILAAFAVVLFAFSRD